MIFIVPVICLLLFIFISANALKRIKPTARPIEIIIGITYLISLALFAIGIITHNNPYHAAIDPVDGDCYSPFAENHGLTLLFYILAFNISLFLVWKKNRMLPPLTMTLSIIFILIGVLINFAILLQISVHDTSSIDIYYGIRNRHRFLFVFAPISSIVIGILLCYNVMTQEITEASGRIYSSQLLNKLNTFLATKSRNPFWILIFMFPIIMIVTLILILFGQDINSLVKVFTDTTTWKLSQQIHPPILDHKGHYLCTVAAAGHPKIVKPLRIGKRNGTAIIVNRQLLVANAFEEMIQDFSPKLHQFIRRIYDNYGYNISTKINSTKYATITYILMKPLEWLFLCALYLLCINPEHKINKQYAAVK